ncbi:hypothetical protein RI054_01g02930 [Pseudoscourfieldia marina]
MASDDGPAMDPSQEDPPTPTIGGNQGKGNKGGGAPFRPPPPPVPAPSRQQAGVGVSGVSGVPPGVPPGSQTQQQAAAAAAAAAHNQHAAPPPPNQAAPTPAASEMTMAETSSGSENKKAKSRPASLAVPLENPEVKGGTVRPVDSVEKSAAIAQMKVEETKDTATSKPRSAKQPATPRGPPPLKPPTAETGLAIVMAAFALLLLVLATAHDHGVFWHALDSAVLTVVPNEKAHGVMMALRNASFDISFWAFAATAEVGLVWCAYLALLGNPGMWVGVPPSLLAAAAVAVGAFRERPWAEGTWVATTPQVPLVTSVAAAAIGSFFLGRAARRREELAYFKKRTLWERAGVAVSDKEGESGGRTTPTANLIAVARTPSPERKRRAREAKEAKEAKAKAKKRGSKDPGDFEFTAPSPPTKQQNFATASGSGGGSGIKQRKKKA